MTKLQITPGPWEFKHSINRAAYRVEAHPYSPGHTKLVALTLDDLPQDEANARAIAALPVLIEAAQKADEAFERAVIRLNCGGDNFIALQCQVARDALRSALSQATGGQSDRCQAISEQGENPGSAAAQLPIYQSDEGGK